MILNGQIHPSNYKIFENQGTAEGANSIISPVCFGGEQNLANDIQPYLQQASDFLGNSGGTVLIPFGIYVFSGQVILGKSNITVDFSNSIIKVAEYQALDLKVLIIANNQGNLVFRNARFGLQEKFKYRIFSLSNCSDVEFRNITFENLRIPSVKLIIK